MRVQIRPTLLRWARRRAGIDVDALTRRFPKYVQWEAGEIRPTLKQLDRFARTVRVPVGYLFLPEPPDEPVPIPDFRVADGGAPGRPSPDLLDAVYLCERRQDWYREYACLEGLDPIPFVGSATPASDVERVAADIRSALRLDLDERCALPNWLDVFRHTIDAADALGVLVMVSGIVGNNTHRALDPAEFRGVALVDERAPLVFVNAADAKAAQLFTLVHGLAHLWLGQSALWDSGPHVQPSHAGEAWCSRVAAQVLVPLEPFIDECRAGEDRRVALKRLARRFNVSAPIVLRRMYDVGCMPRDQFRAEYEAELGRPRAIRGSGTGGDIYSMQIARVGKRFAVALVCSTLEGRTLYREALQLLCVSRLDTFRRFADASRPYVSGEAARGRQAKASKG